ncbi:Putative peptidyl-prolyl cis-trans isomerase [Nocardioides dokdonensis FR1436]|uniref:Putative peptidyl-prolyl cis-trans isomerase n=1 Tax=Nocardioides dokdonensis FR1436 TaxID=1300347 RepID=A0A1A9GN12_9ACTN|nr:peptidylprolyl isomerase [Nocardioides dokdonensis]ANH39674.1 Putative peptidyl-prolyl cis-trans isomerase [Nocardioides dokdonensis FR1436]
MLTRSLATAAVLACVGALAACGSENDTAADASPASESPQSPESESGDSGEFTPAADGECAYVEDGNPSKDVDLPPADPTVEGDVEVTLSTSIGDLDATLDAAATPCTVGSFVSLAEQSYFDATTCHRLTTEGIFVLQCGDPTATGTGGPGYTIPDELSGEETYPAGTLAMAKTPYPDSGGSQFFIVYDETPLPPQYTVFGTVDADGVKAVAEAASAGADDSNGPGDGAPRTAVDIEAVTVG